MEIKQLKIVYDGQGYWLLWHWENRWFPNKHPTQERLPQLSGYYLCVTGPFESAAEAEKAITERVITEGPESGALRGSRGSPKACLSLFRFAFAILSLTSL